MFDFYNTFYKTGYLDLVTLKEATKWGCITKEEFKTITGEDYNIEETKEKTVEETKENEKTDSLNINKE